MRSCIDEYTDKPFRWNSTVVLTRRPDAHPNTPDVHVPARYTTRYATHLDATRTPLSTLIELNPDITPEELNYYFDRWHDVVPVTSRHVHGKTVVTEWKRVLLDAEGEPIDDECNCDLNYDGTAVIACNNPECVMRNDLLNRAWRPR